MTTSDYIVSKASGLLWCEDNKMFDEQIEKEVNTIEWEMVAMLK